MAKEPLVCRAYKHKSVGCVLHLPPSVCSVIACSVLNLAFVHHASHTYAGITTTPQLCTGRSSQLLYNKKNVCVTVF